MNVIDIADDKVLEEQKFIVYGAGNVGKMVHKWLRKKNKKVLAFCDSNSANYKKKIIGVSILSPEICAQKYYDFTFIVANEKHYTEIIERLEIMGINKVILCNSFLKIKQMYILSGKYATENKYYLYDRPQRDDIKSHIDGMLFRFIGNIKKKKMICSKKNKKKYEVSLCLIFYNEAKYLKEWINYHRIIGVDHFYLYDHLSTDNSLEVLQPYIDMGIVEVVEWKDRVGQMTAYIDCAKKHKDESEWIGFIDTDEFIVPVENNNIKDFLKKFNDRGSVLINWKYFGYNGKVTRNTENLVVEDFTQTTSKYSQLGKCFWNTKYNYRDDMPDNMMQIHYLYTIGKNGKLNPLVNCFDEVCNEEYQFAKSDKFPIQINHYMHKSYDEYCERKKHGSATTTEESYRNIYHFYNEESKIDCCDKKIFKYIGKLKSIN